MARKIQVKRGAKADIPVLAQGEFGFTTDAGAEELFIGNGAENIPLARQDNHEIETYTSLASLGLNPDEMATAGKDLLACLTDIFEALTNKATLRSHLNTASDQSEGIKYLANLFRDRLKNDVGITSTHLDICFEKIGVCTMEIRVVPQNYVPAQPDLSGCMKECSAIFWKQTSTALSPFVMLRTHKGPFSAVNLPHKDDVGALFINQPEHVDQMLRVAKSYYLKDAQYLEDKTANPEGRHYFNYHQWYTCLNNAFGYQTTLPCIWPDSDEAEGNRRQYSVPVAQNNFLDCSAYIGLVLRGIPYEKSPYTLAAAARVNWDKTRVEANVEEYPWAMNPYDWHMDAADVNSYWEKAAYTAEQYTSTCRTVGDDGVTPETVTVHTTDDEAKYAYYKDYLLPRGAGDLGKLLAEHGCSVDFNRDFSNVEPGDIILYASKKSSGAYTASGGYKHCTHIAICGSKEPVLETDTDYERFKNYPYKHRVYDSTVDSDYNVYDAEPDIPTFIQYIPVKDEAGNIVDVISERYLELAAGQVVAILRPDLANAYGRVRPIKEGGTGAGAVEGARKNLGVHTNVNLLEGWYFADPINQKGQTEFPVSSRRYTLDRWVATANALVSIVDGGIRISNAVSSGQSLVQYLEPGIAPKEGEPVTLSCLTVSGELYSGTVKMPPYGSKFWTVFTTGAGVSGRVYSAADDNYNRVVFLIPQGAQEDIAAVKFERGSVQTLAVRGEDGNWVLNDPPPNKVLEQQKCKWYFERIKASGTNLTLGVGTAGNATKLYVTLPISPKRVKPSADALTACVGNLRYGTGTLTSTPTAVNVYSIDLDSGLCTLEITGTFTTGTAYRVGLVAGGYLDFDSNL